MGFLSLSYCDWLAIWLSISLSKNQAVGESWIWTICHSEGVKKIFHFEGVKKSFILKVYKICHFEGVNISSILKAHELAILMVYKTCTWFELMVNISISVHHDCHCTTGLVGFFFINACFRFFQFCLTLIKHCILNKP